MATQKKSTRGKSPAQDESFQVQAERLSRRLGESAQQIWLAGVGALGRAQAEGSKLFETLVSEGVSVEQSTRKVATGRVEAMRDAVESRVEQARGRASETWERLENVFEERVQQALRRLDVPSQADLAVLSRRIDVLSAQLQRARATTAATPRKAAVRKPAAAKSRPAATAPPRRSTARKAARGVQPT